MSLLYMDGFEGQDYDMRYTELVSGYAINSSIWSAVTGASTRFNSGSALSLNPNTIYNQSFARVHPITECTKVFIGLAMKIADTTYGAATISIQSDNGAAGQCYVHIDNTNRSVAVYRGMTASVNASDKQLGGTAVLAFPREDWFYLELSAVIGSTTGSVEVRIDGKQVLSLSGVNTQANTSFSTISAISIGANNVTNKSEVAYFDDLYVCDDQGTTNNTFLGDVRVQTLTPNGTGSSTQLTPTGSASNYANVNDVPDSNTTYNSSSTVGQRDTYVMSDLVPATSTVYGVQQVTHAFKTTAGEANIKSAQLSNGTVSYGATNVLGTANEAFIDLNETNPATSAPYTPTDINDIEAGAEVA